MSITAALPPRTKLMNVDEFIDWCNRPENINRRFELVRGKVIEVPPPTKVHGVVSGNVAYVLGHYIRQRGAGYITTNDAGTQVERDPDTVRGPDVAYFTDADRFKDLHPKYGEHPPVLAVEVLSPNDRVNRVLQKIDDYLNNGVQLVWLIDPDDKIVRIFRPGQPSTTLTAAQEIDGGDALPGFHCALSEFFLLPKDIDKQPSAANAPPAS
jgi:Uma2 family endonuclease